MSPPGRFSQQFSCWGMGMDAWVEHELAGGTFPDLRLKNRLGKLLGDLGARIGGTLPMACQDWAATKAAYRFFDNPAQ